jgi:hypothetical protein
MTATTNEHHDPGTNLGFVVRYVHAMTETAIAAVFSAVSGSFGCRCGHPTTGAAPAP